jgi:hypothetical protein
MFYSQFVLRQFVLIRSETMGQAPLLVGVGVFYQQWGLPHCLQSPLCLSFSVLAPLAELEFAMMDNSVSFCALCVETLRSLRLNVVEFLTCIRIFSYLCFCKCI